MSHRLLIVTPARNEGRHLTRVARALAAQRRRPDLWVVVDDGSEDDTPRILRELAGELPFLRVVRAPRPAAGEPVDRLAAGAAPRAFNRGLATAGLDGFTHVGKLDGDVELPPHYYERLLAEFDSDPRLGIAGGDLVEPTARGWRRLRIPRHHVHGAVKLYSRACLESIGGLPERLAWDTIDETTARMRGYATRTLPELVAVHHRPLASASGVLRGRARHGTCAYVAGFSAWWVVLRAVKVAAMPPVGVSGAAFLFGYARAAATGTPRVEDPQLRRYARAELRARARRAFAGLARRHPPAFQESGSSASGSSF